MTSSGAAESPRGRKQSLDDGAREHANRRSAPRRPRGSPGRRRITIPNEHAVGTIAAQSEPGARAGVVEELHVVLGQLEEGEVVRGIEATTCALACGSRRPGPSCRLEKLAFAARCSGRDASRGAVVELDAQTMDREGPHAPVDIAVERFWRSRGGAATRSSLACETLGRAISPFGVGVNLRGAVHHLLGGGLERLVESPRSELFRRDAPAGEAEKRRSVRVARRSRPISTGIAKGGPPSRFEGAVDPDEASLEVEEGRPSRSCPRRSLFGGTASS